MRVESQLAVIAPFAAYRAVGVAHEVSIAQLTRSLRDVGFSSVGVAIGSGHGQSFGLIARAQLRLIADYAELFAGNRMIFNLKQYLHKLEKIQYFSQPQK